ncbi:alpha/beta-Hydrolases superfamily protein [Striga hermonthica]|uniref:Alpha/beta-Hydrolases superfamily protein n=1 Tax=Striga hermonthica TaxID=68872 RepID=A0A9N7NVL2_STRHE|nr:alpha/beta-Hydrolases superfamily protein [Striga hermonthica]
MAAGPSRKISAASARAHTRRPRAKTASKFSGILKKILVVVFVGLLAWAYQATRPPPPKTCGSADGPPVTASRVQLRDGRYLAYHEFGVTKEIAKRKIVFIHGFHSCRHDVSTLTAYLSPDIVENEGISIISFDRPGYGESDPHPTRTVKSLALDIEELADRLGLGSKFYVVGFSMGGQVVWSCLKYIPHRLAGAALIAPVVNYWWPALPSNLSGPAYVLQPKQDQWALRVAHYLPWLTYWWNTQRFFPVSSVIAGDLVNFSDQDKELLPRLISRKREYQEVPTQQGVFESLHRDTMIGFGRWEFDPTDIENPFSKGEGSVHLWQGDDDRLVPVSLQRYIAEKLPWIHYHELPGAVAPRRGSSCAQRNGRTEPQIFSVTPCCVLTPRQYQITAPHCATSREDCRAQTFHATCPLFTSRHSSRRDIRGPSRRTQAPHAMSPAGIYICDRLCSEDSHLSTE